MKEKIKNFVVLFNEKFKIEYLLLLMVAFNVVLGLFSVYQQKESVTIFGDVCLRCWFDR